jgi:serine protease Do
MYKDYEESRKLDLGAVFEFQREQEPPETAECGDRSGHSAVNPDGTENPAGAWAEAQAAQADQGPVGAWAEAQADQADQDVKKPRRRTAYLGIAAACLCAALIGGGAGGFIGYKLASDRVRPAESPGPAYTQPQVLETDKHYNLEDASRLASTGGKQALSVMDIDRNVGQTVVGITTEANIQGFFGQQTQRGSGSGIIIRSDGYVLTNNHVIEGASNVKVHLKDGEEYPAVLVGYDAKTDLAIIKIDETGLPAAILGDSSALEVGEMAVAIGNPLGELQGTVTVGIISALGRTINIDGKNMNLLQTDAAINFGNSGGALVNSFGEVIGVNTAKTSAVGVEGLGFAIPIDDVKPVIEALISHGYVKGRPKIGVASMDVTEELAARNDLPVGVYVKEVEAFSAAERAGIKIGDVITEIDGQTVKTTDELNALKEKHQAGDTIKLTLIRDGFKKVVDVTLMEEKPEDVPTRQR